MRQRDKAIIEDLTRFRCMTRDDVAELHFSSVRQPAKEANGVLLRLKREGHIGVSKERRMYVYFPIPSIKKDSAKLAHFLTIVDFYKQLKRIESPRVFEVEPKLGGKGLPEPDAFCIWKGAPWYIEIQRSVYTVRQMDDKLNRYEQYYLSGEWEKAEWQPVKKMFPYVWIVGAGKYEVGVRSFKVIQASVDEMVKRFGK